MRRDWILAGVVMAVGGAAIYAVLAPRKTSAPKDGRATEAGLRALARRFPDQMRAALARKEAKLLSKADATVPTAVRLAPGTRGRLVSPIPGEGWFSRLGSVAQDGTFTARAIPFGEALEKVFLLAAYGHEVRLLISGEGLPIEMGLDPYGGVLSEGRSAVRPLGTIPLKGGRYEIGVPGTFSEGIGFVRESGPAPVRVALAPGELPADTKAEPGGYALLFNATIVWQMKRSNGAVRARVVTGGVTVPFTGTRLFTRERMVSAEEAKFWFTSLAHVYRRRGGRWRYARTWRIEGAATALQTDDPAGLSVYDPARERGTPKGFVSVSAEEVAP